MSSKWPRHLGWGKKKVLCLADLRVGSVPGAWIRAVGFVIVYFHTHQQCRILTKYWMLNLTPQGIQFSLCGSSRPTRALPGLRIVTGNISSLCAGALGNQPLSLTLTHSYLCALPGAHRSVSGRGVDGMCRTDLTQNRPSVWSCEGRSLGQHLHGTLRR